MGIQDHEESKSLTSKDVKDLNQKSLRGGAVTLISQALTIVIQLTSTVVLARLLSPSDYGTLAMVVVITAFAGLFRDLGLSSAAIQKKNLTRSQQSNLFWLNVAMGLVLTGVVASISPLVARFYDKPELTMVTLALSMNFLIGSLGTQHGAMLVRRMQFIRQSMAKVSGALTALMVSILLALQGYSYWSLVWGGLSGAVITTGLLFILSPFRPMLPNKGSGIREMVGFGANVTAFDFVNYFARNLDNILIGRVWGAGTLGFYSRAYSLLMFPITAIRGPITSVAYPAMSRLQDNPEAYRSYYRGLVLLLSHMTMPIVSFLFVCSELVVELALGEQWLAAAPIFSVLAVTAFIQSPYSLTGMVQLSLGRSRRYFVIGTVSAIAASLGFCVGVKWGAIGVASAYAIVTYVGIVPILKWAFKDTPLNLRDFFGNINRPLFASCTSAVIIFVLKNQIGELSLATKLPLLGLVYITAYLLFLTVFPKGRADLSWGVSTFRVLIRRKLSNAKS